MRRLPTRSALAPAAVLLALLAGLAAAGLPAPAAAAEAPAAGRPLTAGDLAWIAGSWTGTLDSGSIEELWTPPTSGPRGQMLGAFRWLKGEKVIVYELLSFEPGGDGGLVLKLRHFGPGLVAWEEKEGAMTFHLVSSAPGEVTFDDRDPARPTRLTYRKDGDDALIVYLDRTRDGKPSRLEFRYRRAR